MAWFTTHGSHAQFNALPFLKQVASLPGAWKVDLKTFIGVIINVMAYRSNMNHKNLVDVSGAKLKLKNEE